MTAKKNPKTTPNAKKNTKAPNTPKKPKASTVPDQPVQTSAPDTLPDAAPEVRQPADLEKIQALAERQAAVANDLRVQQGKPPVEFAFRLLPIEAVQPSQHGEDYFNASSQGLAQDIAVFGASGREADYAPIAVDEEERITDGNHRHCAYLKAGFTHVPVLVPKAPPADTVPVTEPESPVVPEPPVPEAATTDPSQTSAAEPTPAEPAADAPAAPKARRSRNPKAKGAKAADNPKLSALDAAAKVLGEEGRPMNCAELIGTMAIKGYWRSPGGQTPAATLYSALLREVTTKGDQARFRKTGPGHFTLRSSD